MSEVLTLTFAEIEFFLRTRPVQQDGLRERLRLADGGAAVAAAGVASLVARGLCTVEGSEVRPTPQAMIVIQGLTEAHTMTEAVGWIEGRTIVMHLLTAAGIRLAIFPSAYGQFRTELLDPAEPLADPVVRFLDACTGGPGTALLVRSGQGPAEVSAAIARDADGQWFLSDTADSPDRGVPTTREAVVARLAALLGPQPVGATR